MATFDFGSAAPPPHFDPHIALTVTIDEVGDSAFYLFFDLGRGVTGEILHVDAGYHVVGMKNLDAPDITVNGNGE